MGRTVKVSVLFLMVSLLLLLSGCQNYQNFFPAGTEEPSQSSNGLINGWLSTYDVFVNEHDLLCLDWSGYQPATGTALVCFEKQNGPKESRSVSSGNTLSLTVERNALYRFAVWYGDKSLIAAVQNDPVPENAWRYFRISGSNTVMEVIGEQSSAFHRPPVTAAPSTREPERQNSRPISIPTAVPAPRPTRMPTAVPTVRPTPTPVPRDQWTLQQLGVNRDPDDIYSNSPDLRAGSTVFFHALLSGGSPSGKVLLHYDIFMNGTLVESSVFSDSFGNGSYVWVCHTPSRGGTLSVSWYYYDHRGRRIDLGQARASIREEPRTPVITPTPRPTPTPTPTPAPHYSWTLQQLGINRDPDDRYTNLSDLRVGDTVYFHALLSDGAPSEKILLYYDILMDNDLIETCSFSDYFGNGSYVWVSHAPSRSGTLSVRWYYYDSTGRKVDLGRARAAIQTRNSETQTAMIDGWIPACDVYYNRYGNLCFDMQSYVPTGSTVIYFIKNDQDSNVAQGTVSSGLVFWDSPVPGRQYSYAIWCGDHSFAGDVAAMGAGQIPSSAWIRLSVTEDHQISIISSRIPVYVLPEEQ